MKKSERILVVMVAVAVIYGVVDFSLGRAKKRQRAAQQPATAASQTQTTNLAAQLGALSSANDQKIDQLTVSLLVDSWPAHVFVRRQVVAVQDLEAEKARAEAMKEFKAKAEKLVYTGFVAMGDDHIAIINGMDYRVGEEVEGLLVAKITQDFVQVSHLGTVVEVPAMTEQDTAKDAKTSKPPVSVQSH